MIQLLLRLPVGRGGVINSPRSIFLFCFFLVSKVGLYRYVTRTNVSFFDPSPNDQRTEHSCAEHNDITKSCAAAHGLYRCAVYRLLSEPMSTRLLNSISSRICRQNT